MAAVVRAVVVVEGLAAAGFAAGLAAAGRAVALGALVGLTAGFDLTVRLPVCRPVGFLAIIPPAAASRFEPVLNA